jgi:ubiquinone/menaquinone biosynthesis C-methylase UbiE
MKRATRYTLVVFLVLLLVGIVALAPVLRKLDYRQFPARASWQLPNRVIDALGIEPGTRAADIGAGEGYFTFPLADAVGSGGSVYAVDVDDGVVRDLREAVESRGYDNVEVVLASVDDPNLPDGAIDVVFFCNVYHHIDDRIAYFDALRQDLKPGGRVAIIEVSDRLPIRWLSPPGHSTPRAQLRREMESAGYRLVESFDFLPVQDFVILAPRP